MSKTFNDYLIEQQVLQEKLITFGGKAYPKFGQVVILAGGAGCYPHDTEYFTGTGWNRISEYNGGNVLQFNPSNDKATLTSEAEFVKLPIDQFTRIKNARVDFTTSQDHKHLVISEKTGQYEVLKTTDLLEQHNNTNRGNKRKLATSFFYSGNGIDLSDDEIRLRVAIYADGHFMPRKGTPKCRMSFKKERKVVRFEQLLTANGIGFKKYLENGFTRFEFNYPVDEKEFNSYWYDCSSEQLRVVTKECLLWDGSNYKREGNRKNARAFYSFSKKSIDFIQFAFHATNNNAVIGSDEQSVNIAYSNGMGISKNGRAKTTTEFTDVDDGDGNMYCFTVPTGYFVVRQKGKIYVSGNSGKGFTLSNILGIEGKVFDVDAIKVAVQNSVKAKELVKKETGVDVSKLNLKDPENVAKIHGILSSTKLLKGNQKAMFADIATLQGKSDRLPNLIFDVTLKDAKKLKTISDQVTKLGYQKEDIHLVWVVNDIKMAQAQNAERDRVVPEDILLQTHIGASKTILDLIQDSNTLRSYMDGDVWFSFNKFGVDSNLVKSSKIKAKDAETSGVLSTKKVGQGAYIADSIFLKVKPKGKSTSGKSDISKRLLRKVKEYIPNSSDWVRS